MHATRQRVGGFSLVEMVIVIVILGVIGAIAIPRMSRGAAGAGEAALTNDLSALRRAVELYRTEHLGLIPEKDSTIAAELTMCTDIEGNTSPTKSAVYRFGPYIRSIPPLPVGENRGDNDFRDGGSFGDGSEGWFYNKNTGEITANTKDAEVDSGGVPFNTY